MEYFFPITGIKQPDIKVLNPGFIGIAFENI